MVCAARKSALKAGWRRGWSFGALRMHFEPLLFGLLLGPLGFLPLSFRLLLIHNQDAARHIERSGLSGHFFTGRCRPFSTRLRMWRVRVSQSLRKRAAIWVKRISLGFDAAAPAGGIRRPRAWDWLLR